MKNYRNKLIGLPMLFVLRHVIFDYSIQSEALSGKSLTDAEKHIFVMHGRSNPSLLYLTTLITGAFIIIWRSYITRKIKVGNQLHQTALNSAILVDNEGFHVCQEFSHTKAELRNLNFSRYREKILAIYIR